MRWRFVKIDWTGFARTGHWLKGFALFDYILKEAMLPGIVTNIYKQHSFLPTTKESRL